MIDQNSILITSEAEAWNTLECLLKAKVSDHYVEFQGWPNFDIVIKGERYSSTVPADLLSKLSNVQGALNTFYGRFVYEGDARNLKKYEKYEIELVYTVKKSSTDIKADATGLLNKMGEAMSKPGTQKVAGITLCVLALIISGAVVISKKSSDNRDIEIQKLKLLEKAIEKSPELKDASKNLQDIYRSIIVSASDANNISIGTQHYSQQKIQELAERNRSRANRVELSGEYKIKSLRGYQNHYLLDVQINKDISIRARVLKSEMNEDKVKLLIGSITGTSVVPLTIAATQLEDGYANAIITKI